MKYGSTGTPRTKKQEEEEKKDEKKKNENRKTRYRYNEDHRVNERVSEPEGKQQQDGHLTFSVSVNVSSRLKRPGMTACLLALT